MTIFWTPLFYALWVTMIVLFLGFVVTVTRLKEWW